MIKHYSSYQIKVELKTVNSEGKNWWYSGLRLVACDEIQFTVNFKKVTVVTDWLVHSASEEGRYT